MPLRQRLAPYLLNYIHQVNNFNIFEILYAGHPLILDQITVQRVLRMDLDILLTITESQKHVVLVEQEEFEIVSMLSSQIATMKIICVQRQ